MKELTGRKLIVNNYKKLEEKLLELRNRLSQLAMEYDGFDLYKVQELGEYLHDGIRGA